MHTAGRAHLVCFLPCQLASCVDAAGLLDKVDGMLKVARIGEMAFNDALQLRPNLGFQCEHCWGCKVACGKILPLKHSDAHVSACCFAGACAASCRPRPHAHAEPKIAVSTHTWITCMAQYLISWLFMLVTGNADSQWDPMLSSVVTSLQRRCTPHHMDEGAPQLDQLINQQSMPR